MSFPKDDSPDGEQSLDLFQEPVGFYPAENPATFTDYTCRDGVVVRLRLVGHSPLWVCAHSPTFGAAGLMMHQGHLLWNAGQVVADYLQGHAVELVRGKTVLELGAGAGLPSIVAALLGASKVVVTDYPDANLIENLKYNIAECDALQTKTNIEAEGFIWGGSPSLLMSHLPFDAQGFDLLILADILFNHSEQANLVKTVQETLKRDTHARALVFFTPYRPWLLQKDLHFFQIAKEAGFRVRPIAEQVMDKVMFDKDPGDELLRRTVFGYEVCWQSMPDEQIAAETPAL